jgi:hypothetical protein
LGDMPQDKHRLSLPLGPQVPERALSSGRTSKFSSGTGSGSQHNSFLTETRLSVYHASKFSVKTDPTS